MTGTEGDAGVATDAKCAKCGGKLSPDAAKQFPTPFGVADTAEHARQLIAERQPPGGKIRSAGAEDDTDDGGEAEE